MSNRNKRIMDGTKMLWHMDRVHAWERGEKIAPIYIDMGATKKCNINCAYCYGDYQQMTGATIERNAIVNLFKDAPYAGIKGIGLVGDGEPTLNPHIYEAMEEGKKRGLDIAISTNGIRLNEDKLENILRNCKWMRFNLSAGTREGYKTIHGADLFYKVYENIMKAVELKRALKYECDIGLQAVFVPKLMDNEIIEEAKLAQDLGVDYLLVKQCSLPENNSSVNKVSFTINDIQNSIPFLKEAEKYASERTDIVIKWNAMNIQKEMMDVGKRPYEGCLGIPFLLQISGNGKVYPCGHLFGRDEFLMGDIHEQSIKKIINSDKYWNIVEKMKNFDVNNDCHGMCRQDKVNEFLYNYMQKPRGVNFI